MKSKIKLLALFTLSFLAPCANAQAESFFNENYICKFDHTATKFHSKNLERYSDLDTVEVDSTPITAKLYRNLKKDVLSVTSFPQTAGEGSSSFISIGKFTRVCSKGANKICQETFTAEDEDAKVVLDLSRGTLTTLITTQDYEEVYESKGACTSLQYQESVGAHNRR